MTDSNTVYVNDKKIKKVIITADSEGNNIPNFKYNRQNNTWWINDEIISNAIIITDNGGNNAFKSLLEPESKDVFKEVLLTVHEANQSKHVNINLLLEKKRLNFINKLRCASEAFHTSSYLKAYKTYKECLQIYDADDYPDEFLLTTNDLVAIKLALALSRLGLGEGEDLKDALHILMTLKAHCVKQYPILCYYLGLTFYLLHFYEEAQSILQEGLKNLEEVDCLNELYWPGSNEQTIYLSDKATLASDLETLYNECKIYRKPDALCQYLSCPNKSIFFSNPCFNGYVNMKCSKDCNFSFHRECWKHKLKNNQIKKPSLLIDSACGTPDCGGLLKEILIYDKRLNINTTIPSNAKISETSKKLETKPGVNAKDLTEKPVPDNKSDKKLTSDSFSKFKTTEQKNTFSSFEKNTQTQKFVFVNTHTQTSIQTKEKQIQTVRMEKPHQNTPQTKEKRIQTDRSYSTEINSLKAQIDILRVQLFQAEEAYNELLHKYNGHSEKKKKLTFDCETQTPNAPCTDCKKNQNLLEEKAAEGAAFKIKNQELLNINKELRTLTTDLKATVARNKSNYEKNNKALIKENLNLKTTVQSLQSSLAKKCDTKEINIPIAFQKLLTEQFNHINETYMSYFSMYENKCKYMTWELHDLISLATYDSFPSQQELEENLAEWTTAQEKCKRDQQLVTTFFSKLALKYSPEHFTKVTVATPLPNLLKEPPNIMMRHFKAILALNRKLEQDMNKNLLTFYTQPQPQPQLNNENINSKFLETFGACSSPQPSSVPADNAAKETEIKDPPRPNLFNSIATNEIASNSSTISKPPMKKDSVPKPTLVGQDKLLQRIEQHFPLAPPQTLTTALQTIRQRHGGLTGRDFKSIVLEVKTLIKDISGSTKEKVKISPSKQSNENASLPPWKQVASGVKWSNENPDLNCTICFDFMEKRNSVNLRCQHMFHSKCIRKWLQTNSICPICRMFAILDDEFPPLK